MSISNEQINKNLSEMVWNLIKKDIFFGKLNIEKKISANFCQINQRTQAIQDHINENQLHNSGLIMLRCITRIYPLSRDSHGVSRNNYGILIKLAECEDTTQDLPPVYTPIATESSSKGGFINYLKSLILPNESSAAVVSNQQININAAARVWNLIEKDILAGKLKLKLNDEDEMLCHRAEFIKTYINKNYLHNSGLMIETFSKFLDPTSSSNSNVQSVFDLLLKETKIELASPSKVQLYDKKQ